MTSEERENIKKMSKEFVEQKVTFAQDNIDEVVPQSMAEKERDERIKSIIKRDFERFKQTFQDLA